MRNSTKMLGWSVFHCLALLSCSARSDSPTHVAQAVVATASSQATASPSPSRLPRRKIGDHCSVADRSLRSESAAERAAAAPLADGKLPLVVPTDGEVQDPARWPPGVGYCITANSFHPHGYFTMNCSEDGDCPAGSLCHGTFCISECRGDPDCSAPAKCLALDRAPGKRPIRMCGAPTETELD
jgi:hypothetical protein